MVVTRLYHIVISTGFISFYLVSLIVKSCKHNDWDISQNILLPDLLNDIISTHIRQHHVTYKQ